MSMTKTCKYCRGTGKTGLYKCRACKGYGYVYSGIIQI